MFMALKKRESIFETNRFQYFRKTDNVIDNFKNENNYLRERLQTYSPQLVMSKSDKDEKQNTL